MVKDALTEEMRALYARGEDPWNYRQANRHWLTAALVGKVWRGGKFMELPCAEGYLTMACINAMDPYPSDVIIADLVPEVVEKTMQKVLADEAIPATVWAETHDFRVSLPKHRANLILVSDVLPYVPEHAQRIVDELYRLVLPLGHLVLTSWLDTMDGVKTDPCFGRVPVGGRVVQELTWEGQAMDLNGEMYPTAAAYRVIRKD